MITPGKRAAPVPSEAPQTPGPLSSPRFRWFFAGRLVSYLGGSMTPVALTFGVLQVTNDPKHLGFILAAGIIPLICFTLIGGGLADRFSRDVLLRVTHTGAGISQAAVAFCVITQQNPLVLIPLVALNGAFQAFTSPALRGIVPQLVATADLRRANSLLSISRSATRIMGPPVAGLLVALTGGGPALALDAFSYLVAAFCMTRISLPGTPKSASRNLLRELKEGWGYFRTHSWIWSVTLAFAVLNAVQMGVWQVLGPVIANQGIGAAGWGVVSGAKAVGLLVAGFLALKFVLRRPLATGLCGMALNAIPFVLLGMDSEVHWLVLATFIAGIGSGTFNIAWETALQSNVPNDMISRVSSYDEFGSYVAIPVGQLSVMPIAAAFGAGHVAVAGGILFFVVTLLPLLFVSVRRLEDNSAKA
ncbi:MFS transporter [Streptomyces sp. NBC_00237]|uniref:MFS transporter n=1 Tax=Streptomyces sp. NBC_00237 TaxID=2975687 RepID=UPI00224F3EDC|nr:MFS transporter [Streptomyces sp. NBC_00237]MCX5206440.1 MFS transporter [Streptomyces sp. NBC_00237]